MKSYITIMTLFFYNALYTTHSEKHITVIIPSYNNAKCYHKNLDSVFSQNYHNYNVIYIDDASPDKTGNLVASYIKHHPLRKKIKLIKNTYNRKALANVYKAVHMCDDDDLIVILDGDDWFSSNEVLAFINELYNTEDIWFAYAQYRNVPEKLALKQKIPLVGYARETPQHLIDSRDFRNYSGWHWSGLYSFYAGLFKQIQFKHLIFPYKPFKGKFFPTSKDGAMIYAMLEMCGEHFAHIPEILLHRNIDTPLNDFKINRNLQRLCGKTLRTFQPYKQLQSYKKKQKTINAELIIIPDRKNNISAIINNIHAKDFKKVHIIHDPNQKKQPYSIALNRGYTIREISRQKNVIQHIKEICQLSNCSHIFIANSHLKKAPSKKAASLLERLSSKLLLCNNAANENATTVNRLPIEHIEDDVYALCTECYPIHKIKNICGIYEKNFLQQLLKNVSSINELKEALQLRLMQKNNVVAFTL